MGMKIVHSWLAELVDLPDDPAVVAELLSDLGLAVESVDRVGSSVPGVVTARVLRTERHPDAAKVHRVFVDAGDGVERHVWCGAFNMESGDVVPLAMPGTAMPDGRVIEPKPILGIRSDGMLCSASELGIGLDHSGILLLDRSAPLGRPYGEVLGFREEVVYDLDVLRNRPEAFGHVGVARDIAARLKKPLKWRKPDLAEAFASLGEERSPSVEILNGERCARFSAVVLSGIEVGQSPDWMASRLAAAGMRAINNVVDASNYVMLELNQPNHPYDFDALGGGGFKVRVGRTGESIVTLDDVVRNLNETTLMICDAQDRPIGLAGIMGGKNSEISDTTSCVVLETAWFESFGIMKTVQEFGLRTEASARFERGVDPLGVEAGIARFIELLRLSCPNLVVHAGFCDESSHHLPSPTVVDVRPGRVSRLLGTAFSAEQIAEIISPIGFEVLPAPDAEGSGDEDLLRIEVPSWRPDCALEIDIVEEVARLYGYGLLGKTIPKSTLPGGLSPMQQRRRILREVLHGLGANEAMPHPFLAEEDLTRTGLSDSAVRIVNPLAVGDEVLRTSLRPGLLKAISFNESHRRTGLSFYEIGHIYPPSTEVLPDEREILAVIVGDADASTAVQLWREVSDAMGWGARLDQSAIPLGMHPTRSATLSLGKTAIGAVGEIHPAVLSAWGIGQRCAVLELDLTVLLAQDPKIPQWKPTSRFPTADFDLAFVVPESVTSEKVEKALRQGAGSLVVGLELFDVYRSQDIPGSRGLAYRMRLQATDRTLTDSEIGMIREKCIEAASKLGALLRQ